ncbi:MAG TPA: thiamine phosphate synthase [Terriglobales bacterium]|jgi:thiamine-phosphate pyrophosphorylase|nr:thiamine phosphate synthase [Terriglobales bacterium]
MLLYYITDRSHFPGTEIQKRERLLVTAQAAARAGVEFIQLREKDLTGRELEALAGDLTQALQSFPETRLLINSRSDIAIAAGAHGVHLPANDISADEARTIFTKAGVQHPIIAVSCHTFAEIVQAESNGADFAVFGPVFEKEGKKISAAGLATLHQVCNRPPAVSARMPVLALGGVTLENASACLASGAAGIAGIRLFQTDDPASLVGELKKLEESEGKPSHEGHRA